MTFGVLAYGGYVPHARLKRSTVAAALGGGTALGCRAVASYDEDTTTMAVEAARGALRAAPKGLGRSSSTSAVPSPPISTKPMPPPYMPPSDCPLASLPPILPDRCGAEWPLSMLASR